MKNTVYPARRIATSGMNYAFEKTFSAPLSFGLQNERIGASYFTNYYTSQSEAAVFIKLNLVFMPLVLLAIYKRPKLRGTLPYYLFIATTIAVAIIAIRIFTPLFNEPFKWLLLGQVPNERLEIGLMLLCIMQLAILGSLLTTIKQQLLSKKEALLAAAVGLALFWDGSFEMAKKFPLFIASHSHIALMVIAVAVSLYLVLRKKTYAWGLALFLAVNIVSSIGVNPLYAGPRPGVLSDITKHIKTAYPNDGKKWAAFDHLLIENIPQMAGKPSITGVQSYPQLALWQTIDPNGEEREDYNRYAHTAFTVTPSLNGGRFSIPGPDTVLVHFDCDLAQQLPDFGYALTSKPIEDSELLKCLTLSEMIPHNKLNLFIYKYSQ